ncbi:MAG: AAA family ATPase [Candidatus Thiodiazotropha sp. (ex Lucinoma borealis)]|nr:AAA family ATPase [Candidatus Thiodiazotropha sp. (ex Lucinoma borealis)]MCU7870744.1 AAA family ATPase [Candidatus Thiodiazotropha sp. (ex Lucinoma borealis)]
MRSIDASHYLLEMQLLRDKISSHDVYPFSLPVIRNLENLIFHPSVTFIIGENGTGKSTLLEAIATAWGFNPEGGTLNFKFSTRSSHSDLYKYIRLVKSYRRPRDGFFLRAESYFNVGTEIEKLDEDFSFGPPIINSYGGKSLHEQSHGESFFSLMLHRFGGQGLYILDEPEAALSPTRQMAMLSRIHQLLKLGSQFIIATHSPIILAFPNSQIYELSDGKINLSEYEETEHFQVTKHFLNRYKLMLKELID